MGAGLVVGLVLGEQGGAFRGIREVNGRGGPHPVGDTIFFTEGSQGAVHHVACHLHVRTVVILEGDVLHGVHAEEREFADVLIVLCDGPGVVGVRRRAVTQLMAAYGHVRGGRLVQRCVQTDGAGAPVEGAQQFSHSIQRAPAVGAQDPRVRSSPVCRV